MTTKFKPENYSTVSPYLIVNGAAATITFLEQAFDGAEIRRFAGPGGTIMHAEVRVGDSVIMLADANEGWPAIAAMVHVYVPDVEVSYQRALAAGAEAVQPPQRKEDEDRRGAVKGPGGISWWLATYEG